VDRTLTWGHIEAILEEENKIQVTDVLHEVSEELDFRERVVNMSLGYNYLVVTTTTQCHIFNVMSWETPVIFDIKEIVTLIVQGSKYFCLVDRTNGIVIYNYTGGAHMSSPKYSGLRVEFLNKRLVSLSTDVIMILDTSNPKIIRCFDIVSGKPAVVNIEHSLEITELILNQTENPSERKVAFIDTNKDLFISPVHKPEIVKICTMVDTFMWNERNDILSCVADARLISWLFPNGVYIDKDLMEQAKVIRDVHDLGKFPQILSFTNSLIQLRKFDGSLAAYPSLSYASKCPY
jgi:intraflagellar transport protein 80